ncbi:MAG: hypothetical protein WBP11_12320 [Dokdonella sp.]
MSKYRTISPLVAFASAVLCLLAAGASAQSTTSTLEERMSQKDFEASGLNRLTPAELSHLNAWLGARPVVAGSNGNFISEPMFYPESSARQPITARIVGQFQGWRGKTRVTLDNDQVWEQAESGAVGDVLMTDPEVSIKPMMLGSWLMNVKGCGCSVRVKRVE